MPIQNVYFVLSTIFASETFVLDYIFLPAVGLLFCFTVKLSPEPFQEGNKNRTLTFPQPAPWTELKVKLYSVTQGGT